MGRRTLSSHLALSLSCHGGALTPHRRRHAPPRTSGERGAAVGSGVVLRGQIRIGPILICPSCTTPPRSPQRRSPRRKRPVQIGGGGGHGGARNPLSPTYSPGATQRPSSDSSARPAKLSQQARLEWPVAMDWHRESDGTAVLAVDVVAAVNAEEQPAVPLERLCQNAPGR